MGGIMHNANPHEYLLTWWIIVKQVAVTPGLLKNKVLKF